MNQKIKDIYMYIFKYKMEVESKKASNGGYIITVHNRSTASPFLAYQCSFLLRPK